MTDPTDRDSDVYRGTPGWVKAFGILAVLLILLVAFILITGLGGPHGPQRHAQAGAGAAVPTVAVHGDATIG